MCNIRCVRGAIVLAVCVYAIDSALGQQQQPAGEPNEAAKKEFGRMAVALADYNWETPEARAVILDLAVRVNVPQIASVLRQFVNDPDASVRNRAIVALVNSKSPSTLSILAALLDEKNPAPVRVSAVLGMQRLATPDTAQHLLTALKDKDPEVRRTAIHGIGSIAPYIDADQCVLIMKGTDENAKVSMLEAAPAVELTLRSKLLKLGLEDKSVGVREAALLGNCRGKDPALTADDLAGSVADETPAIRRAAAFAAGALMDREAASKILTELAVDKDITVRETVALRIANRPSGDAVSIAKAMLTKDAVPSVRVLVIRSLGTVKDPAATSLVVEYVEDTNPQVALVAILSLARQESPELAKYLRAAYERADRAAKVQLIPLLGRLPDEEAKPLLEQTVQSDVKECRWAVARNLDVYPQDLALSCAPFLVEDKEASIRFAVTVFLAKHKDTDLPRKYLTKLAGDPDKKVAKLAKQALDAKP